MNLDTYITEQLLSSADLRATLASEYRSQITQLSLAAVDTLLSGKKILLCGNGGSASDAEHIAAEFVGRFRRDRIPLPAIALTANGADLTAIGNDFGFDHVFSRQIYALGQPGDLLIAFSTSGRSRNVCQAVDAANELGMTTVGLTGMHGNELADLCDFSLKVPSSTTAHIQECHMAVCHLMCEIVDETILTRTASGIPELRGKVVSLEDLLKMRPMWESTRQTLVWTNGCFDLLHIGHVRNLQQAKAIGDILVVGINSDESVRALKGANRPFVPEKERAEIVAALDCVDKVVVFNETTPERVIAALKPNIHCKGADYSGLSGKPMPESEVVTSYGGTVQLLPIEPGHSTTDLITKIARACS